MSDASPKPKAGALCAAAILISFLMSGPVVGQPAKVGEWQDLAWTPNLLEAEGASLHHEVHVPGAAFLKPRFVDVELERDQSLVIIDAGGRVIERLEGGTDLGRAFWGLTVPGHLMRLELRLGPRARAAPGTPPFRLDGVLVGDPVALARATGARPTKSVCAPADFEEVACYEGDAAKWANVLATAGVLTAEGGDALWCTAVNVSPRNYLLTTESCLPNSAACANAEFIFGYYRDGCGDGAPVAAGWRGYRCLETVASSPFGDICDPAPGRLDFSLHRAAGDPAGDWGWRDPDATSLSSGERLYIVQHAGARPLEITHGEGADVVVDGQTLRYFGTLDTESSSVGAPIFRDADDTLVGLHHCGGCASPGVGNRGVRLEDIRPLIEDFLCEPALTVEPATAGAFEPLTGNGDAVIDPGETWRFTPAVRNAACAADTTGVAASFAVAAGSAPVILLDGASTFGDLAAGTTAHGTPIRFTVNEGAACAGTVQIDMVSIASDGGGFAGQAAYAAAELGDVIETTLLRESFDAGLPPGWTVVDGGSSSGPEATWTTDDPGDRQIFESPFAIVDSEFLGPGEQMDEQLITEAIDTAGHGNVTLRFRHDFRWFDQGMDERADVEVRSTATGGTWTPVASFQGTSASGAVELDLSALGAPDLEVRFRYSQAEWEHWWAVDDVEIVGDDGPVCFVGIYADGFESGDTDAWSSTSP